MRFGREVWIGIWRVGGEYLGYLGWEKGSRIGYRYEGLFDAEVGVREWFVDIGMESSVLTAIL